MWDWCGRGGGGGVLWGGGGGKGILETYILENYKINITVAYKIYCII